MEIKWIATEEHEADIFTKILDNKLFCKNVETLLGKDEYMWETISNRNRKGVRFHDNVK